MNTNQRNLLETIANNDFELDFDAFREYLVTVVDQIDDDDLRNACRVIVANDDPNDVTDCYSALTDIIDGLLEA